MRRHLAAVVFLWFAIIAASAQEAGAPAPPQPTIEKLVPITSAKPAKKSDQPPPCPATFSDSLETNSIAAKVGGDSGIVPPKVTHSVIAQMSDEARIAVKKKKVDASGFKSVISLVVDVNGNPTSLCLRNAAGYGLDAEAGNAIRQYRFTPAMKGDTPVAARISVESTFRVY